MTYQQEIQEKAEKLYPEEISTRQLSLVYHINDVALFKQSSFTKGAQWAFKQSEQRCPSDAQLAELINYIENDAEIAIPIEDLMGENGNGLTKKEYGLVLLKHLVIELREKFVFPKVGEKPEQGCPFDEPLNYTK